MNRCAVALAALVLLCAGAARAAPPEAAVAAAPQAAPDFSRPDLGGHKVRLSALRGKVVLLNFWATWCAPCLDEVPRFAQWQQAYGRRRLRIVGVSMDDEEPPVRAAYARYRLNYPVVMGEEKLGQAYGGIYGLPVTLLVDRAGRIRFRHQGASDLGEIEREVRSLLEQR